MATESNTKKVFLSKANLVTGRVDFAVLREAVYEVMDRSVKKYQDETGDLDLEDYPIPHYPDWHDILEFNISELIDPDVLKPETLAQAVLTLRQAGGGGKALAESLVLAYLCQENGMDVFEYRDVLDRDYRRRILSRSRNYKGPLPEQPSDDALKTAKSIMALKNNDLFTQTLILHGKLISTEVPERIQQKNPAKAKDLETQLKFERKRSAELMQRMAITAKDGSTDSMPTKMLEWHAEYNDILSGFRSLLEKIAAYFTSAFSSNPASCNLTFFKEARSERHEPSTLSQTPRDVVDTVATM